ncbi:MAG: hypothetical protein ABI780_05855 [Ardenticatenales bacterium]
MAHRRPAVHRAHAAVAVAVVLAANVAFAFSAPAAWPAHTFASADGAPGLALVDRHLGTLGTLLVEGDFAFLGEDLRLRTLDVKDPARPRTVAVGPFAAGRGSNAVDAVHAADVLASPVLLPGTPSRLAKAGDALYGLVTWDRTRTIDPLVAQPDPNATLVVLDAKDPARIRLQATLDLPLLPAERDDVSGDTLLAALPGGIAVVAGGGGPARHVDQLVVVDARQPERPAIAARVPVSGTVVGLAARGSMVYVLARQDEVIRMITRSDPGDAHAVLTPVDLTDPAAPRFGTPLTLDRAAVDVRALGGDAIVFSLGAIDIIDLADPLRPVLRASAAAAPAASADGPLFAFPGADGAIVGTTAWAPGNANSPSYEGDFYDIFDVSDPRQPSFTGRLPSAGVVWGHRPVAVGPYVALSSPTTGLGLFDARLPRRWRPVADVSPDRGYLVGVAADGGAVAVAMTDYDGHTSRSQVMLVAPRAQGDGPAAPRRVVTATLPSDVDYGALPVAFTDGHVFVRQLQVVVGFDARDGRALRPLAHPVFDGGTNKRVWAVAADGPRLAAFTGEQTRLVDIGDPTHPVPGGAIPGFMVGMALKGTWLAQLVAANGARDCAPETCRELRLVDVADVARPRVIAVAPRLSASSEPAIAIDHGLVFISDDASLVILRPVGAAMTEVGRLDQATSRVFTQGLAVRWPFVFITNAADRVTTVDIREPSAPRIVEQRDFGMQPIDCPPYVICDRFPDPPDIAIAGTEVTVMTRQSGLWTFDAAALWRTWGPRVVLPWVGR